MNNGGENGVTRIPDRYPDIDLNVGNECMAFEFVMNPTGIGEPSLLETNLK